jgi:hypothetical protein
MKNLERQSRWFRIGYWDGVRNGVYCPPDPTDIHSSDYSEYIIGHKSGLKEWEEDREREGQS